jgi:predicted nucleic acid-binding protein
VTVIDSSAFVKFLLKEEGYEKVRPFLQPEKDPHSVSMLLAETGNVLWKYQRMGSITREKTLELYTKVMEICNQNVILIESNEQYGHKALKLAIEYKHSFYDMLFISQAICYQTDLITVDKRQTTIAEECGIKVINV